MSPLLGAQRSCWARSASPCEGGLSKEHYFTRGLWPTSTVTVYGFPFLNGQSRELSVDAMTAKVLCAKHNSELSPVDQAAIDTCNALREVKRLDEVRRAARKSRWQRLALRVDGHALERWALKTTAGAASVLREDNKGWTPPDAFVSYAFGAARPESGVGLAVIADEGDRIDAEDEVALSFVKHKATGEVGGSVLRLRGLTLLATWQFPVADLMPLQLPNITGQSALWHPNELRFTTNVALRFDWSGTFRPEAELEQLRRRYPGTSR